MSGMSIQHHPGEAFLLDYASGALSEAWSIAIATHLAMCPECRRAVSGMETIGAGLMESLESVPLSPSSLATLMDRINEEVPQSKTTPPHILQNTASPSRCAVMSKTRRAKSNGSASGAAPRNIL